MTSHKHNKLNNLSKALYAIYLLLSNVAAYAASDGICSTASLINPTTINGGMGGTGMPANGGFGGTGITDEHGGPDGTGSPVAQRGMGGTGDSVAEHSLLPEDGDGGIAIVGVITGFASICVDGVEVQYTPNTPVFDNGKVAKLGHLAAGKMVILKAERVGGQLQARAIGMFDAVAGPVGRVDVARQQMQVMGQTVRVDQNTIQQMRGVTAGTDVRVSGHRLENGEIVATRVDVTNSVGTANIISSANTMGLVTSVAIDSFVVNGTRVNVSNIKMLNSLNVGSEVRVGGAWDGKAIKADRIETQPIQNMINRSDTAIVEGFLGPSGGNKFNLYGTQIQFSKNKNSDNRFSESKLVKIEMRREKNGDWVADKVEARKGKLFEKAIQFKNENDSSDGGNSSKSVDEIKSDSNSSGSNSGSGYSSGSGSNSGSGSSSGSGHGSSSGSSRPDSSSRSSGSSDSSHGGSVDRSSSSSSRSSGSSGSGSSGRSGSGSGSGKYK
ncbi:MAG: DUF5666 domain-containing protein [Methylotenera sp.]